MATTDTIDFTADGSAEIRIDDGVLYVTLSGRFTEADVARAATETLAAADRLDEGFAVVIDFATVTPAVSDAIAPFGVAQSRLASMGVSDVVRVVGPETDPAVSETLERAERRAGYEAATVESVAAAERFIEA